MGHAEPVVLLRLELIVRGALGLFHGGNERNDFLGVVGGLVEIGPAVRVVVSHQIERFDVVRVGGDGLFTVLVGLGRIAPERVRHLVLEIHLRSVGRVRIRLQEAIEILEALLGVGHARQELKESVLHVGPLLFGLLGGLLLHFLPFLVGGLRRPGRIVFGFDQLGSFRDEIEG